MAAWAMMDVLVPASDSPIVSAYDFTRPAMDGKPGSGKGSRDRPLFSVYTAFEGGFTPQYAEIQ
jgi:hypothetical protein